MDLEFSDDQRLLKELIERFAADVGGLEPRRAAIRSNPGWSRTIWGMLAELGLLGLPVAEAAGGLGGGGVELMIVGEAFGRHLLTEPFLDSAVMAGVILSAEGGCRDAAAIAGLLDGSRTFALIEQGVRLEGDRLCGRSEGVPGGGTADQLIVAAGNAVYLVEANAAGVTCDAYQLHGGGRAADIIFEDVAGRILADGHLAADLLARVRQHRVAFLAAEALGAAEAAFETTIDYLTTRVQFGQPLGANQALQHRAAEMLVELEQLRSAATLAACTLDAPNAIEQLKVMAAVAMVTAKAARFIAQQSVQLHGGMGVTDEHPIGHWFLRLTAICVLLDSGSSTRLLASLGGFVAARPYWDVA